MEVKIIENKKEFHDILFDIHCSEMLENDRMTKTCFYDEFNQKTRKYYVAFNEHNQILGYIGLLDTLDDYNIIGIAVKREYQKRGIGSKLLKHVINVAKKNSVKTISLEVDENNTKAINFYKKNEFVLTNIRKNYYKNNDAYIMWYYL